MIRNVRCLSIDTERSVGLYGARADRARLRAEVDLERGGRVVPVEIDAEILGLDDMDPDVRLHVVEAVREAIDKIRHAMGAP